MACESDNFNEELIPEGYGRLQMTIAVPEAVSTRSVTGNWLAGSGNELIHEYWVLICTPEGNIADVIHNTVTTTTHDDTNKWHATTTADESALIAPGEYKLYAIANFTARMLQDAGLRANDNEATITATSIPADFTERAIRIANGYGMGTGEYIPMSFNTVPTVTVRAKETTDAGTLVVWRMMAKLEFDFINESSQAIDVLGVEIEPLNNGNVGVLLQQPIDLNTLTDHEKGDIPLPTGVVHESWTCKKTPEASIVNVPAKSGTTNGTGTFMVYVNESDATFSADENQYSLRFKVKRNGLYDEFRFGFTTKSGGFNVIRRNDWIKIPIHFTDWQFRIEALSFVPIAGFAAHTVSADALSTTFNTGGYISLSPLFRHITDPEGAWRSFDDSAVTFVMPTGGNPYGTYNPDTAKRVEAIDPVTNTGIILTGDLNIFTYTDDTKQRRTLFHRLGDTNQIVAELDNNDDLGGTVTVTLRIKLGVFTYEFSHNIIKAKKN